MLPVRCITVLAFVGSAAAQEPTWLREFGGSNDDAAYSLQWVQPGRVLMAGGTFASLFAPNLGHEDVFLAWFDDAGTLLGGVQFGTNSGESALALAPAPDTGVFVAGLTGGSFGALNAGGADAWVARRNAAGGAVWVRQIGTPEFDVARALCPDGAGGVFVTGDTLGSLGGPSLGSFDSWAARYDESGRRLWLIHFGTSSNDASAALAPDGAGGCFIAGSTSGSLGGPSTGFSDAWIARFDSTGTQLWIRQIGTPLTDTGVALAPDGAAGVFWAGATDGALGGPSTGWRDAWIARYDAAGDRSSIVQFGSAVDDWPGAVCTDGLGGVVVAGLTNGSLGGPSAGFADAWVARLHNGTAIASIDQIGSASHDDATALASTDTGTVFAAGYTYGNLAPGGGGFDDAWLARYDLCYPDCNADGTLTVGDFGCFQTRFMTSDLYADCNADGILTVQDFGCFQTKFVVGCP